MVLDWTIVISHAAVFLMGGSFGVVVHHLLAKFAQQRRLKGADLAAEAAWRTLEAQMSSLLEEMRSDRARTPHVRELIVLEHPGVVPSEADRAKFRYFESDHPELRTHLASLETAGYLHDVSVSPDAPAMYRMTNALIGRLAGGVARP